MNVSYEEQRNGSTILTLLLKDKQFRLSKQEKKERKNDLVFNWRLSESNIFWTKKEQFLNKKMEKKFDVIVIGAGAAGLSAAERLLRFKIDNFLVLEARNRIGEWMVKNFSKKSVFVEPF